jgi:hypothetical protein
MMLFKIVTQGRPTSSKTLDKLQVTHHIKTLTNFMQSLYLMFLFFQEIDRVKLLTILEGLKVSYDNDVGSIRTREKPEYIQIQTAKMLLIQLKPFTKTWALPGDGPNNFKVKPMLNKKLNIRFGKEALALADRVLMGPGRRR